MNINNFKENDVITRNEPCAYNTNNNIIDGSYLGERIILLGHDKESKIIFFLNTNSPFHNEPQQVSYARDPWDEGWVSYPETMWHKICTKFSKKKN
jgi:hypothetical protein